MLKPICVPCQRFYRPAKNGYYFMEGMPKSDHAVNVASGRAEPEKWQPYKLWVGDLWRCPDCGSEIVVGVNGERLAEHYEHDFAEKVERTGAARLLVKDC